MVICYLLREYSTNLNKFKCFQSEKRQNSSRAPVEQKTNNDNRRIIIIIRVEILELKRKHSTHTQTTHERIEMDHYHPPSDIHKTNNNIFLGQQKKIEKENKNKKRMRQFLIYSILFLIPTKPTALFIISLSL